MGKVRVRVTLEIDPKTFATKLKALMKEKDIDVVTLSVLLSVAGEEWASGSTESALEFDTIHLYRLVRSIEKVVDALNAIEGIEVTIKDLI